MIKPTRVLTALLGLALTQACASATTATPTASKPEAASHGLSRQAIPKELADAVHRSEEIGRQLYVLDKISSISTDVLSAKIGDLKAQALGGYLPVRESTKAGQVTNTFAVRFYTNEQPPRVKFLVRVTPDLKTTFEAPEPPEVMTPAMLVLVKARQAALNAVPKIEQALNPMLLPGEALGKSGVLVYLLATTERPNVAVIGRHYRAVVPYGASEVSELTPLSQSVLELPTQGPAGQKLEALVVAHWVTDYPLETHVLVSLQSHLPLLVTTRRGGWLVKGDHIEFWGPLPGKNVE